MPNLRYVRNMPRKLRAMYAPYRAYRLLSGYCRIHTEHPPYEAKWLKTLYLASWMAKQCEESERDLNQKFRDLFLGNWEMSGSGPHLLTACDGSQAYCSGDPASCEFCAEDNHAEVDQCCRSCGQFIEEDSECGMMHDFIPRPDSESCRNWARRSDA